MLCVEAANGDESCGRERNQVAVVNHEGPLSCVFEIENRPEHPQNMAALKRHLLQFKGKPFLLAVTDFHFIRYLGKEFLSPETDIPALCEAVKCVAFPFVVCCFAQSQFMSTLVKIGPIVLRFSKFRTNSILPWPSLAVGFQAEIVFCRFPSSARAAWSLASSHSLGFTGWCCTVLAALRVLVLVQVGRQRLPRGIQAPHRLDRRLLRPG